MELDDAARYEALRSRDARFDGRFWVGVHTTSVYCRPVCPSRLPKAENVSFFAHPAAAEDHGFRPCLRCQPDAAPGSDRWRGSAAVVDRALALIADGALDGGGATGRLAARLHVSERHLRRLFAEHLGTTPDAVARSRRSHLARRLLVDTDRRVADVAFAAGFGSVRQCNDVIRATFHATPSELRRRSVGQAGGPSLFLAARPPFDGDAAVAWFARRAIAGVESAEGGCYRRRVRVGSVTGDVVVRPVEGGVNVSIDLPPATPLAGIVAGVRRLFDLDADPAHISRHLRSDARLAPLVDARPGLRVPGSWSGFEALVRAVVGQQISIAAATTVLGRIVSAFGPDGTFPVAEDLVSADLESTGLVSARAGAIRAASALVIDGSLAVDGSRPYEEFERHLLAIRGIGPWTVAAAALRFGDPDAFPAGDLQIRRILGVTSVAEAEAVAEPWRPWRAYATQHLWLQPMEGP